MLSIFGKKGKPHDSVAATLKTSIETAGKNWFGNSEAYFKNQKGRNWVGF